MPDGVAPAAALVTRRVHLAYSVGVMEMEAALPDTRIEATDDDGDLIALVFATPDGAERDIFVLGDLQRAVILRGLSRLQLVEGPPPPRPT